ncbi:MAG: hypothetical protein ACFFE8_08995 [Candidatus Heimdallarchaeota archaeon]
MDLFDPLSDPLSLTVSVVLSLSPLIVLAIPYLFTRRKKDNIRATIYNRGFIGFCVFYLAYFIFPSFLNALVPNPSAYLEQQYYPISNSNQWSTVWDSEAIIQTGAIFIPIPLLVKYLFQHFVNSIVIFLTYPVVILAFVFGLSPFLSMGIILYQTWGDKRNDRKPLKRLIKRNKEDLKEFQAQKKHATGDELQDLNTALEELEKDNEDLRNQLLQVSGVGQRIREIQYETENSPFQEISIRVKEKDWDNERELLKVLIAILPITLFLLNTILLALGEEENPSLLQGTSMGWFLEIFFAYIAAIVFSVYLIKASRLSRKGKFLGNQLYVAMVQSLSTVGAFMSILAVFLFLILFSQQIFVISYFVVYFLMVSIFFVLFLDIFEPFSIYLLIKIIETSKDIRTSFRRISMLNTAKSFLSGVSIGILLAFMFFAYRVIIQSIFVNINTVQYDTFFWLTQNYATFLIAALLLLLFRRWNWSIIGTAVVTYLSILTVSLALIGWYSGGWATLLGLPPGFPSFAGVPLITPFITIESTLAGFGEAINLKWLTSVWKMGKYADVYFLVPELHQIPVIWRGTGGSTFLGILSIPYNLLHPLAIILIFGALLFLARIQFHTRTQKGEGKTQYKSVFSDMTRLPSVGEISRKSDIILIGFSETIDDPIAKAAIDERWEEIDNGEVLRQTLSTQLRPIGELSNSSGLSNTEIHHILDELTFDLEVPLTQVLSLLHREFAYSFEEVTIDSLHVMMLDGRAVLAHTFGKESMVEPALVSGLFSAITSFAKETVRSEQLLRTIDHGDVVLTIEYAKWVFAAIFADSTSTELRRKLTDFLVDFEKRYAKVLPTWLGNLDIFKGEQMIIDREFMG